MLATFAGFVRRAVLTGAATAACVVIALRSGTTAGAVVGATEPASGVLPAVAAATPELTERVTSVLGEGPV